MSNQEFISASEFCDLVTDGTHDSPKKTETGIKLVTSKNIVGGSLDLTSAYFISELDAININKRSQVHINDVLLSMIGTVGEVALIEKEPNFVIKNVGLLKNSDSKKAKWLYYYLKSPIAQNLIKDRLRGTTQQYIPLGELRNLPILKPKNEEHLQNAIEQLSSLDKKIQLNTQINQTLEQIAQALFKSWFVDFDPVRAKAQAISDGLSLEQAELAAMQAISGKTPEELTALSQTQPDRYAELAETAKAFPCEMVEVDGVEVPKGWKIGTFTDITESRREKVKNDKATVLSAVSSGELVKSEEYFTKQVFSKSIDKYLKVYQWDFAYNPARINIGSIGLHEAAYLGAVSPVYEVFSVSDKYHWFLKRILNLETTKIKIQSLCTGSVRQTLKLKDFQSIDCVIPDEKTLSIFNKKWEEYRTLILENNKNTQTLSEIRDLLLPRLLSGEFND